MAIRIGLTKREEELLEALIETGNIREAAEKLGITIQAAYSRFHRIRKRYDAAVAFIEDFEKWRKQLNEKGIYL